MLHTKYEGSKPYIVRRFFRVFPKKAYVIHETSGAGHFGPKHMI